MTKISVIIPVYNAQEYLKRCLASVCNQTLNDIEIIAVDDFSLDDSYKILKEYAKKYPQLKIIRLKQNSGESVARNKGLELAKGEYLAFVDNDDKLDLDFYEKLYNKAKENDADIVKGNVKTINYDTSTKDSGINILISQNGKWYFHYEWWSAIFKRKLIEQNKIKLPEGYPLGGDSVFLNKAVLFCDKISVINDTSYYYYRRENSGDSKILSYEKINSSLKLFEIITDNINQALEDKKIDDVSYAYLYQNYILLAIEYIFRCNDIQSKKLCAERIFYFYKKCIKKDNLDKFLNGKYYYVYHCLIEDNIELMNNFVSNIQSKADFYKQNMLRRLRSSVDSTSKALT